ncbi:TIGR03854 family LLM class F420-dependent oxidoreductase [Streptomyces sp. NBC_00338]|uniref:TIGR03854 family LLM class F420-dependent oxidoreductase n=1 Tax=unclassified Streptomyces TaxID=2593676 RepID=UPI00224D1E8E|nr:TIGR03854 family LLM class F420-dependent oxidoreductase [Streptomyces sp. NBC_00338]MCX5144254.1 TIGR03854 family LLM class F420-dependent oxidoreductase [Streptomyces sp. NBC_00338]WSU62582.1 TIGR03854 family LLM class F420-dependent oxidoreductase [Streptomyces sp. NBC_01104]
MKIRFGVGLGAGPSLSDFSRTVDRLEGAGIDSLWLSEQVYSDAVDPFIGMAHALSRTSRLKVGTSVAVLPGRHPVLVAKQLASLAALSPRRVLPVFGLQPARPGERELFPAPEGRRGALFDESLELLRASLRGEAAGFDGEFHTVGSARIGPLPARPLDIWLGGSAPAGLRRVGRYGDGWLGSFLTPEAAGRARETIQAAAAQAGREIEPDHFGISLVLAQDGIPDDLALTMRRRDPESDPRDLVATDWPGLHRLLDAHIEAGLTKFVIYSAGSQPFDTFLDRFEAELLPRQN